jgi:hypothetical protein
MTKKEMRKKLKEPGCGLSHKLKEYLLVQEVDILLL